jgi:uncharacterized protein YjdB
MRFALPARRLGTLALFAALLAPAACGDGSTDSSPTVASVAVSAPAGEVIAGETMQLSATPLDDEGKPVQGRTMAWSSDNAAVATVSDAGLVTGVAPGSATISAAADGRTGTRSITVLPVPVASVAIEPAAPSVVAGQQLALTLVARDAAGNALAGRTVTLVSANAAVATVSGSTVTGVAPGTTMLTATSEGKTGTALLTVTPVPVASVSIVPTPVSVTAGATLTLSVVARDAAGNPLQGRTVALTSSDAAVFTVTGPMLTGVAPGTATLTATVEGKTATAPVTVTPVPVASVAITPPAPTVMVGSTLTLGVVAYDAQGRVLPGRAATLTSAAPTIATVSGNVATGVSPGSTMILATVEGRTAQTLLTVTQVPVASVAVELESPTIHVGTQTAVRVVARDAAGNVLQGRPFTLATGNPLVALVGSNAVRGIALGTTTITATVEGKTGSATLTVTPAPVATVEILGAPLTVYIGRSQAVNVVARDAAGTPLEGRAVTLAITPASVATLNGSLLTGLVPGTATLTATVEGKTASTPVTVAQVPVATVSIEPNPVEVYVGDARTVMVVARDEFGVPLAGRAATLVSSDAAVASVSGGSVRGEAAGSTTLTATVDGKTGTATVKVLQVPVHSVAIFPNPLALSLGENRQLTVEVRDAVLRLLTGRAVAWASSAPSVATVSATGFVTTVSEGVTEITATVEGKTATLRLNVSRPVTMVGGIIGTSTTWTRAASPYRLSQNVQVAHGATLTIEPGVEIEGVNRALEVFGTLNAVGTAAAPIVFDYVNVVPRGRSGEPHLIRVERAEVKNGTFYAPTGDGGYGSLILRDSRLTDVGSYLYVWYPTSDVYIERNVFVRSGGISAGGSSPVKVYVRNNAFSEWTGSFAVQNWASYGGDLMVVQHNSFLGTARVAVRLPTGGYDSARMSATDNYWGTIGETAIQVMIFDRNDDLGSAGTIAFQPFLTAPHPSTPTP